MAFAFGRPNREGANPGEMLILLGIRTLYLKPSKVSGLGSDPSLGRRVKRFSVWGFGSTGHSCGVAIQCPGVEGLKV